MWVLCVTGLTGEKMYGEGGVDDRRRIAGRRNWMWSSSGRYGLWVVYGALVFPRSCRPQRATKLKRTTTETSHDTACLVLLQGTNNFRAYWIIKSLLVTRRG